MTQFFAVVFSLEVHVTLRAFRLKGSRASVAWGVSLHLASTAVHRPYSFCLFSVFFFFVVFLLHIFVLGRDCSCWSLLDRMKHLETAKATILFTQVVPSVSQYTKCGRKNFLGSLLQEEALQVPPMLSTPPARSRID